MKKTQTEKKKKKPWGLIGALIGTGAVAATGTGLTIYYATRPSSTSSTYTVTIKGIEGATISGGSTQTVLAGSLVGQLPTPFKSNQIFANWLDADQKVIDSNREINSDMEVYASWKDSTEDSRTVTFDLDGGSLPGISGTSIKVNDKTLVGKLPSPTKNGYIFDYWTKNGTKVAFTETITSNITLKANYKSASQATLTGGSRLLQFKNDESASDAYTWVLKDAAGTQKTATWTISKAGGGEISGLTISDGKVSWNEVDSGSYTAEITATAADGTTASTEIGLVVTGPVYTLSGGTTQCSAKFGVGGQADNAWTFRKDGVLITSGITWSVTKEDGSATESTITALNGKLAWTTTTPVGKYDLKVNATVNGTDFARTSVSLIIEANTYELKNGTTQKSEKFGKGGTGTAWQLSKDGTEITTGITWTITKQDGSAAESTITIPGGALTWTAATPVGEYDLKVHATVAGTEVASVNVGLIITENAYTLTGGSRGFTVKPSETVTDTQTWALTKDGTAVTSPSLSITDITPAITGVTDPITIANGKITLKTIPEGTYTFNVAATDDGQVVIKEQVSVISTETYSIQYGGGTTTSLTIKDNVTAVDTNAFTLLDSGSATQTATWELDKSSTSLTDAQLHWDTTDTNKLSYANVPTGTYNLKITAKIGGVAKAVVPFTLISQDTKIALEITGEDTLNFDNGLTSTYKVNSTRAVKWAIKSWTPLYEGESPTINPVSPATGTSTVVTLKNTKEVPGGTLVITATDETSGQTVEKSITVNNPEVNSSKLWTYDDTNHWSSVDMTSACGTGNISITPAGGTTTTIARASFNQQIVFGDEITAVPDGFLNGCTTFNHWVTFGSNSKCLIIGSDFFKGCTAYNNKPVETFASGLVLPNTVQIIGDNFLRDCTSFTNSGFTDFDMPSSLTTIGDNFLFNCKAFNCSLTIANTVKSIGESFMYNCYALDGRNATITINTDAYNFKATAAIPLSFACDDYTQACYNYGINMAGSAATELKTNIFPAITSSTTGEICRKYYSA